MSWRTITYIDTEAFAELSKAEQILAYLTWRQGWVAARTLSIVIEAKDASAWLGYMVRNRWVERTGTTGKYRYRIWKVPVACASRLMQTMKTVTLAAPHGDRPGAETRTPGHNRKDRTEV